MLAKYTPQSLMKMYWDENSKRWLNENVENSKTLDHYQSYDIYEVGRFPNWVTKERLYELLINHEQVGHLISLDCELMEVKTGAYTSILCHTASIPHRKKSIGVHHR